MSAGRANPTEQLRTAQLVLEPQVLKVTTFAIEFDLRVARHAHLERAAAKSRGRPQSQGWGERAAAGAQAASHISLCGSTCSPPSIDLECRPEISWDLLQCLVPF